MWPVFKNSQVYSEGVVFISIHGLMKFILTKHKVHDKLSLTKWHIQLNIPCIKASTSFNLMKFSLCLGFDSECKVANKVRDFEL